MRLVIFGLLTLMGNISFAQGYQEFSGSELKEDLQFLQEHLLKLHPGLYTHSEKEDFDSFFRNQLDRLGDESYAVPEAYRYMAAFFCLI